MYLPVIMAIWLPYINSQSKELENSTDIKKLLKQRNQIHYKSQSQLAFDLLTRNKDKVLIDFHIKKKVKSSFQLP